MYFETLSPPRKIRTNGGPTIGTAAGTPVTILQAQNQLDPMVMNNLLQSNETVTTDKMPVMVTHVVLNPPVK
jgi:hypothetical protein